MKTAPEFDPPSKGFIPRPAAYTPAGIRAWIREVCSLLDTTPTQLALSAGLAASTLNRFMRSTDPAKNISATTIQNLIQAADNLHDQVGLIRRSQTPLSDDDHGASLTSISVVGRVALGHFSSKYQWDEVSFYEVRIPVPPPYNHLPLFGLEVGDNHANPTFPLGSVVIATSLRSLSRTPVNNERLVVFAVNESDEVETTVREYVESPNNDAWLIALDRKSPDIYLGRDGHLPSGCYIGGKIILSIQPDPSIYGGTTALD